MRFPATLPAFTCGLVIVACGSSGSKRTSASNTDPGLRFAQCMRAHGVSNFPDPSAQGQIAIGPSSGVNPRSPALQSAQQSCQKLLPRKAGPPRMSASEQAKALRFAECMRGNGQPDFPDPTVSVPADATRVLVVQGMVFALSSGIDPKSPAFQQAARRCGVSPPRGAPGLA